MKPSRWLIAVIVLAVSSACATGRRPRPARVSAIDLPTTLRIKPAGGRAVRTVPLEDYVRAAIISEFAPAAGDVGNVQRMLEVQAVIARTYAMAHVSRHVREGFDLCSTTHCQLYEPARLRTSTWAAAASHATRETAGMVLWYDSSPARTVFHSDCGGHTSAAAEVWSGIARPYLKALPDEGPAAPVHASWRYDVERPALLRALNADARTRVGAALVDIRVLRRDNAGRAALVRLRGTQEVVVRGEELRAVLARTFGQRSVRSTRFDVHRAGERFSFVGTGFGHGVGLCQAGAYARVKAGARPEQVLARYYPGTRLVVLH